MRREDREVKGWCSAAIAAQMKRTLLAPAEEAPESETAQNSQRISRWFRDRRSHKTIRVDLSGCIPEIGKTDQRQLCIEARTVGPDTKRVHARGPVHDGEQRTAPVLRIAVRKNEV